MAHIIIDRRLNGKGKSSVNRRKFVQRVRGLLKDAVRENIRKADFKELSGKGSKRVRIPLDDLQEPTFHHDDSGVRDLVLPGNDRYVVGDKIQRPKQGKGPGEGGAPDGEGMDEFHFHLTREEFLDLFFENCELPDLIKKNFALLNEEQLKRAGFTITGSPASLNIVRSMRGAKSRKFGLRALKLKKIHEMEKQLEALELVITQKLAKEEDVAPEKVELDALLEAIALARKQLEAIPFIDPMDLRYNHWSKVRLPSVQAVVFYVMDVSGSMGEQMKELAKTFFLLLHLFLEKNYEHVEVVYIKYHSEAAITDEKDFFYGQETGGTVTSTALQLTYDTIKDKYPTSLWNVYLAHASDGDNFPHDNPEVYRILTEQLLPLVQYYAYIHVGGNDAWNSGTPSASSLWHIFEDLSKSKDNLDAAMVKDPTEVYPVFLKLFQRKAQ